MKKLKQDEKQSVKKVAGANNFNLDLYLSIVKRNGYSLDDGFFFYGLFSLMNDGLTESEWKAIISRK